MIRKYISAIALSLALVSGSSVATSAIVEDPTSTIRVNAPEAEKKADESRHHKEKCGKEHAKEDIKMLTNAENIKLLCEDDKKALEEINKLLLENNELSKDNIKTLLTLKEKVAKCKLGEKDYKKFKDLSKKEKKESLNCDEKKELEGYLKKIYCK